MPDQDFQCAKEGGGTDPLLRGFCVPVDDQALHAATLSLAFGPSAALLSRGQCVAVLAKGREVPFRSPSFRLFFCPLSSGSTERADSVTTPIAACAAL